MRLLRKYLGSGIVAFLFVAGSASMLAADEGCYDICDSCIEHPTEEDTICFLVECDEQEVECTYACHSSTLGCPPD
ncbi:MAG: hypothetical protein WEA24_09510 [Gemmatimonadota bacterium]